MKAYQLLSHNRIAALFRERTPVDGQFLHNARYLIIYGNRRCRIYLPAHRRSLDQPTAQEPVYG